MDTKPKFSVPSTLAQSFASVPHTRRTLSNCSTLAASAPPVPCGRPAADSGPPESTTTTSESPPAVMLCVGLSGRGFLWITKLLGYSFGPESNPRCHTRGLEDQRRTSRPRRSGPCRRTPDRVARPLAAGWKRALGGAQRGDGGPVDMPGALAWRQVPRAHHVAHHRWRDEQEGVARIV